jgi:hypothetical protein
MDAVAVMRALLLAHAPLTALVGDRVIAGTVPLSAVAPVAVGLSEVGRNDAGTVARSGPTTLVTARVQVTVYATSYPAMKAALNAARLGSGVFTGTIVGVRVLSVLRDSVGPDLSDEEPGIAEQSRDFIVAYLEPNQ